MEKTLVYSEEKMIKLIEQDKYLQFVFHDLIDRGNERKDVIEILFSSNVLDGHDYRAAYESIHLQGADKNDNLN